MGGFVRVFRKIFSKPKTVVVQQQAPVQATTQTAKATDAKTSQAMAASKAGKYGTSTMMNEATGVEEEANISKTALGGESIKKKKKYA